jgi:hypothetical protein
VHADLLEMALLAESAQRVCRAAVKPGAAQDVAFGVNDLAHERVAELESLRGGGWPEEPSAQGLVECRLGGIRREPGRGLSGADVML